MRSWFKINGSKLAGRAAVVLVALVAGFASFRHIVDVAIRHGEDWAVAAALPFCIDALLVAAVAAMTEDKRAGRYPRTSARIAFGFGVAASMAANVASADPTLGARVVAAVPPVALLLAVEVLTRTGKPRRELSQSGQLPANRDDTAGPVVASATPAQVPEFEPAADGATDRVMPADSSPVRRRGGRQSAAEKVAKAAARTPHATAAQLAVRLNLSERTVQRHLRNGAGDKTPVSGPVNGTVPELVETAPV